MNKSNVLIVEDDIINAKALKLIINKLGFNVTDIASNEFEVSESIKKNKPDVIVMDISLCGRKDGIEIIEDIYIDDYIPVIYLSGHEDDEIVNRALITCPIGYLTKPFRKTELKSTLKIATCKKKKITPHPKQKVNLGFNFLFDMENKHLYFKDEIKKTSIKETKLLVLIIEAKGELVTFKTLESEIWGNETVTDDAIRLLVSRIRKKIKPHMIETVYSYGFKFYKKL